MTVPPRYRCDLPPNFNPFNRARGCLRVRVAAMRWFSEQLFPDAWGSCVVWSLKDQIRLRLALSMETSPEISSQPAQPWWGDPRVDAEEGFSHVSSWK